LLITLTDDLCLTTEHRSALADRDIQWVAGSGFLENMSEWNGWLSVITEKTCLLQWLMAQWEWMAIAAQHGIAAPYMYMFNA
jgi:hypothetical protein